MVAGPGSRGRLDRADLRGMRLASAPAARQSPGGRRPALLVVPRGPLGGRLLASRDNHSPEPLQGIAARGACRDVAGRGPNCLSVALVRSQGYYHNWSLVPVRPLGRMGPMGGLGALCPSGPSGPAGAAEREGGRAPIERERLGGRAARPGPIPPIRFSAAIAARVWTPAHTTNTPPSFCDGPRIGGCALYGGAVRTAREGVTSSGKVEPWKRQGPKTRRSRA